MWERQGVSFFLSSSHYQQYIVVAQSLTLHCALHYYYLLLYLLCILLFCCHIFLETLLYRTQPLYTPSQPPHRGRSMVISIHPPFQTPLVVHCACWVCYCYEERSLITIHKNEEFLRVPIKRQKIFLLHSNLKLKRNYC